MKSAFEANTKMGDPNSLNGQLGENSKKQEQLQADLAKYQAMLQEVMSNINYTPSSQKKSHSSSISSSSNLSVASAHTPHRNSISDESLSRSESETSVNTNGHHPAAGAEAMGNGAPGGLVNGHSLSLSNGHVNGNGVIQPTSLFKLNGSHSGSINGNGSLLSPGAVSNNSSSTLTPNNATAKDENDS